MKIAALVGMAGSGKSEVARDFEKKRVCPYQIRDITISK